MSHGRCSVATPYRIHFLCQDRGQNWWTRLFTITVYSVQTGCAHGTLPKRTEHQEIPACWVKMLGSKISKPSTNKQQTEQKQRRTLGDGTAEWRQLEEVPARGQLSVSQPRSHVFAIPFLNYSLSLAFGQQDSEVVSKFSHNLICTWHIFARGVQKAWSKNKTVFPTLLSWVLPDVSTGNSLMVLYI